jgi:hypothetical protein
MRRTLVVVGVAALGLAGVSPARAADTALTTDPSAQAVAAYGGWVVWSRQASDGTYNLVVKPPGGMPADAPVRASVRPIDAQLSPEGDDVVATFAVCGRRCDVLQYQLVSGVLTFVNVGRRRGCRASGVSGWEGAVAYVLSGRGCGRPPGVYYHRPTRNGPVRLLAKSRNALTTDLRGNQVLWAGEFYLRVQRTTSHRARTLFEFFPGEGESFEVRSPSLAGDGFAYYVLRHNLEPDFGQVYLRQAVTGAEQCQELNRPPVTRVGETRLIPVSLATDGDAVYYTNGAGVYQATDPPPAWTDRGC